VLSKIEVERKIAYLKSQNLANIEFFDIYKLVEDLMKSGYSFLGMPFQNYTYYRAREGRWSCKKDLWYPDKCKMNRANEEDKPVFYCSDSIYTAISEIVDKNFENGGEVTAIECEVCDIDKICTAPLGFPPNTKFEVTNGGVAMAWHEHRKDKLRQRFKHESDIDEKLANIELIDNFLNVEFNKFVGKGEEYKYKITAAIAKVYLENPSKLLNGICYQGVKNKSGSNFSFTAEAADANFILKKIMYFKIVNNKIVKILKA
jgi:hypothetical protein